MLPFVALDHHPRKAISSGSRFIVRIEISARAVVTFVLEPLTWLDMNEVDLVLKAAFKTSYSRMDNLRRYLDIQPSLALVGKEGDEIIAFGATRDYGPFAYIGLMAALPSVQRRGAGRLILEQILSWLSARQCATVLLDASPPGVHLYETHEFVHIDLTLVFVHPGTNATRTNSSTSTKEFHLGSPSEFGEIVSFDTPFFGADRGSLLYSYFEDDPNRFLVSRDAKGRIDGFLTAQQRNIGPWVANDPKVAEKLLIRALEFNFEEPATVYVSGSNKDCIRLLERKGFQFHRTMRHMCKGKPLHRARATAICGEATAGFG